MRMLGRLLMLGVGMASLGLWSPAVMAQTTIRIAEHRQSNIDALNSIVPGIEAKLGVKIQVVQYPEPDPDYLTKLLTELGAGNAPDIFEAPKDQDVPGMISAGYLADITADEKAWDGYKHLFDVAKRLVTTSDGKMYVIPSMLQVQQIYYRKDILEKYGISTAQPKNWADLLARAEEIKKKTGAYALMFPAGVTWGGGTFAEGYELLQLASSTPQLVQADGKIHLSEAGVREVFQFYKDLVDKGLTPIDPLLGPEPWAVPKYQMFPAGKLIATTSGSWAYIYDWGPKGNNPIPDIQNKVGTWSVPGKNGGGYVVVGTGGWGVNAASPNIAMAKKVLFEMGSVKSYVAYAETNGSIPPRRDAANDPNFLKMKPLVPILKDVENGVFLKTTDGFGAVSAGVGKATEALLLKRTDAAGAQKMLMDYVTNVLGPGKVD